MKSPIRDARTGIALVLMLLAGLLAPGLGLAQTTSADIRGQVVDDNGAPVEGAEVVIVHQPSATTSVATTGPGGQFFRSGLRVGGPYEITVGKPGLQGARRENVFLQPGSQDPLRFQLNEMAAELDRLQVTGTPISEAVELNNGVGSTYSARDIANQPAVDRDVIQTLLRDPLAQSDGVGQLSVAGVNPRFNGFAIDGSLQQDDFGLTDGTYATSRSPINLDAIESATLVASDYSVLATGFTGGLVNVVTKSGTNELDGTLYYAYNDDSFIGDTFDGGTFDPGEFEEKEYGLTIGGPLIKDKLFFFFSYDEYENAAPEDFTNFDIQNGVQPGFFDTTRQIIRDTYGFDPGTRPQVVNVPETSERLLAKIDWNINQDHRMSLTYQDTEETDTSVGADEFESAWYDIPLTIEAYNVELFSDWSYNFATNFRLNYKENTRGQNCRAGSGIGQISLDFFDLDGLAGSPLEGLITEGEGYVAGCDNFRHANDFSDERLQFFGSGEYFLGDHVLTFGGEFEEYDLFNLFVPFSNGDFMFETFDDLASGTADIFYVNVPSNNAQDGAAAWGYNKYSFFLQDRWAVTPDFELTYGVRYERFDQEDAPVFSQAIFDQYGVDTSSNLDGKDLVLPRVGFLWTPQPRSSISGGFGLFSGGDPKVWTSNAFQNPTFGAFAPRVTNVDLTTVPQELRDQVATGTAVPIDYIAEDFEIPSDWKASLRWQRSFDMNFGDMSWGDNYVFTAQYLYTRTNDAFVWRNLAQTRLPETQPIGTAPDGRPIYADLEDLGIPNFTELGNVDGAESHVFTLGLAKYFDNGLSFDVSYAYQDTEIVSEGTSSRGISNWRTQSVIDRNNPRARVSPFNIEHTFKVNFAWERNLIANLQTRVDVFGQIFKGDVFGAVFDVDDDNALFGRAGLGEDPFDEDPLYIPDPAGDPRVVYGSDFDQQAFFDYVARVGLPVGRIAEPYSEISNDWNALFNLRFQQELPGIPGLDRFTGENRLKLILDIENFPNLLNDDWGKFTNGPGFDTVSIVEADLVSVADVEANGIDGATALTGDLPRTTCLAATDCVYRFNEFDFDPTTFTSRPQSVYEIRLTLRYDF